MTQIKNNALRITTESADRSWTGVAAAWANWNAVGTAILNDSVNIASFTDAGTGLATLTLTSSMADTNFATPIGCQKNSGAAAGRTLNFKEGYTKSVSSLEFRSQDTDSSSSRDLPDNSMTIVGALA